MTGSSECPDRYKRLGISALLNRVFSHSSNWVTIEAELKRVNQLIVNNGYSQTVFKSIVKGRKNSTLLPTDRTEKLALIDIYFHVRMNTGYKEDNKILKAIIHRKVSPARPEHKIGLVIYYKIRKTRSLVIKNGCLPAMNLLQEANVSYEFSCNVGDRVHSNCPVISLVAVSGQPVELPCNASSVVRDDSVQLVLWYRDHMAAPIYSYDARDGISMRPKEWADPEVLSGRANFRLGGSVGSLVLNSTIKEDEAVYRCRVDFKRQTTTHLRVNLTVAEPISSVRIQDGNGGLLVGVAGPYVLNSTPLLLCEVIGGNPLPSITWWKNGELLPSHYNQPQNQTRSPSSLIERPSGLDSLEPHNYHKLRAAYDSFSSSNTDKSNDKITLSKIELKPLQKEDLRTTYTCRARNHPLAPIKEASVEIDMNFGPSSVAIRGLDGPVSAGKLLRVDCEAKGSRPPAILTWWLDGTILASTSQVTSLDGKVSTSTLQLTLKPTDEGRKLTCRAENGHLPASTIENSMPLQVLFPPRVLLQPGSSLNLNNIKEGDDVYFDCHVKARPKAFKISWKFNNEELEQNVTNGIMFVGESLVLQKVSRKQTGNYSCFASNTEGSNFSHAIHLSVKYAPVCRVEQTDVYGVGRLEKTTVTCRVEADPPANSYRWAFNNTGEFVDISMSHYAIKRDDKLGQRSNLRYSPKSDLDYGTLLCWATNDVGVQKVPCTFTVFPAGKPDAVALCKQFNHTEESVAVVCEPGYGGGMNQSFLLEAWDDGSLRAMDREDVPSLEVTGLRPGTRYTLKVYAENAMGRSQPISFNAFTLTDVAERRTAIGIAKEYEDMSPLVGSVIGGISCVIILIIVGVIVAKCKHRNQTIGSPRSERSKTNEDGSFDSAKFDQEITKVESLPPCSSNLGADDSVPVCDLISTSQDSMLMSRSQDSSSPLIRKVTHGRFSSPTSLFQAPSSQLPLPSCSFPSSQYYPSSPMDTTTYSKLSSQPLEPSAFKDFAKPGSATLSYRQLRKQVPPHQVSYVPVMDYQSAIQKEGVCSLDNTSGDKLKEETNPEEGRITGRGNELFLGTSPALSHTKIPSSYIRSPYTMASTWSTCHADKGENLGHESSFHSNHPPSHLSPSNGLHSQKQSSRPNSNFPQQIISAADQWIASPLSISSQQESSV